MATNIDAVMARLQDADPLYMEMIRADVPRLFEEGFTVDDAVAYLRCLEHVNPELSEKVALERMTAIRARVKERREMEPRVMWLPIRPDFTIECLSAKGTSTNRGYHESFYQIISRQPINEADWRRLDECGLIGMGQAFYVESKDEFVDAVKPVTIDKKTGKIHDEIPPMGHGGTILTNTSDIKYYRYNLKRICDSGD